MLMKLEKIFLLNLSSYNINFYKYNFFLKIYNIYLNLQI